MKTAGRAPTVPGVPIAVQIGLLLGLVLLAAQALVVAIIVLLPPPRPAIYRLRTVSEALAGHTVAPSLVRTEASSPPTLGEAGLFRESRTRLMLAELLHAPLTEVRVFLRDPGPLAALSRQPILRPTSLTDAYIAHADVAEFFGDFVAAYHRPDGRWVVVEPRPKPFPTPWQRRVVLWVAGCLLLVAAGAWWFASRITAPIQHFAEAAQRLQRDPKAPPMSLTGAPELRKAAEAFNEMQVAIQRYIDDRTTMFGAISHDLRTPLSRLRFKLESPTPNREAMLSDLLQMERMIASALEFMRKESQLQPGEALDLRSLLEVVVDDAAQTGAEAVIADGEPIYVHGDVSALQRLFTNLVENALRYGQTAHVEARRRGTMAEIEVKDRGPGLPDEELEAVFRPFYRSDSARNMDKNNPLGGVGLGLSIARAIARAQGGDVVLRRSPEGLTASVTLPLLVQ